MKVSSTYWVSVFQVFSSLKLTAYPENYFEMSHVDASTSLKIYKRFCQQTEKVVAYLGVAKKMQNVINVPIPNLKHVSSSEWSFGLSANLMLTTGSRLARWLFRGVPRRPEL